MYFDYFQKQVLKAWFGVSRKIYNHIIDLYKKNHRKPKKELIRKWIKEMDSMYEWFKQVPHNIKDETIGQAFAAIEGSKTRVSQGDKGGNLGFRTKKDLRQVIPVRAQNINYTDFSIFKTSMNQACRQIDEKYKRSKEKTHQQLFNENGKRLKNNIRTSLDDGEEWSDGVLQYHRKLGYWSLNVRYTQPALVRDEQADNEEQVKHIGAIDPGVKTFATIYSPTLEAVWKVGQGDYCRLRRLSIAYYKAVSRLDLLTGEERRRKKHSANKVIHRILFKINNLKNELHHKLANWLIKTFDIIILPPFNEKSCLSRKQLNKWTHKETRKDILSFSHGKFRELMKYECWKHNKTLVIMNEAYTTKCCTSCGWKNNKVSNKDVFICKNSNCEMFCIDRDINGSRNICLKALSRMEFEIGYEDKLAPLLSGIA